MPTVGTTRVSALVDSRGKHWPIRWSQTGLQTILEATSPYDGQAHRLRLDGQIVFDDDSMSPQPEFNPGQIQFA